MQAVSVNLKNKSKIDSNFIEIKDVKIPKPNKNEILFKTLACGICSTDIEYLINHKNLKKDYKYFSGSPGKKYLGHEIIGKAVAVGEKLNKNIIGKNFIIADINICKSFNIKPECENCRKKNGIHCLKKNIRKFTNNAYAGYSDYFIRSYYQSIKIHKKINPINAIFCEPLASAINCSKFYDNNKILICGLGTISTLFYRVLLLKKKKKKNIFLIVKNENQKKQAVLMGFKNIFLENKISKIFHNFERLFYFSGNININEIMLRNLKPLSKILLFGHLTKIDLDPKILIKKQIALEGIHGYSSTKKNGRFISDIEMAIKYIEKNNIYLKDLIHSKNKLKDAKKTLEKICKDVKLGKKETVFRSILLK